MGLKVGNGRFAFPRRDQAESTGRQRRNSAPATSSERSTAGCILVRTRSPWALSALVWWLRRFGKLTTACSEAGAGRRDVPSRQFQRGGVETPMCALGLPSLNVCSLSAERASRHGTPWTTSCSRTLPPSS